MTEQEIELLIKDICSRLPYGVKVKKGSEIKLLDFITWESSDFIALQQSRIKPYLRPMSSMTDEERMFFHQNSATVPVLVDTYRVTYKRFYAYRASLIDWLLRNHFDWRGLIEQGLALEAPEGMYAQVT